METKKNQYVAVAYKLYIDDEDGRHLVEEATQTKPFTFITGFGIALDAFENRMIELKAGEEFDFSLNTDQAYGEHHEEMVLQLDREMFVVDGKFDQQHIYPEAVIPLQNEEGTRFYGRVVEIGTEKVTVDLNHPLAGEVLHFVGSVVENREATEQEVAQLMKQMTGGCGGNCGSCRGGCDSCGGCE